jgi:predicted RND superfamily exporter protein
VPYVEAVRRLEGTLIGPSPAPRTTVLMMSSAPAPIFCPITVQSERRQTCVVFMLSNAAIDNFRQVVGRHVPTGAMPWQRSPGVLIQALEKCGIDPETARLGGPPIENVAIDEEGDRTLLRLAGFSGLLGLGLAWWSLRSVRLTLIVVMCGVLSAAAGLAIVYWSGRNSDAIMMAMPSMLYVLAISGAVHIVNYYRDAIHEHGIEGAPERAIAHGWKAAFLCNVTTGIGLASLATAELQPIRKFGIYAATGVAVMLIFLFVFLPAALHMWPLPVSRRDEKAEEADYIGEGTIWSRNFWTRFGNTIIRHHAVVSAGCFLFILIASLGLMRVETNIDLLKLFDDGVRVRQDYAWLEQKLGRLVPFEVVVKFPTQKIRSVANQNNSGETTDDTSTLSYLERLELVGLIQKTLDKEIGPSGRDMIGPSLSPVTFAPPIPERNSDSFDFARRSVTNALLEESEAALRRSGYLDKDKQTGTELWRVSLRAASFADIDYGTFFNSVRAVIEPVLAGQRARERALAQVVKNRGAIAGSSVCLWSRTRVSEEQLKELPVDSPLYQEKVYAGATQDLLASARLNLSAAELDLRSLQPAQRDAVMKRFKGFDCVVAVGDVSDAELREIEQAGAKVVDARDGLTLNSDAAGLAERSTTAAYTGVVPIVYKAQRALLDSLVQSSFWSFVTITPLIMIVCRSIWGGAVVMLPNVLPVLVIFGGMGWIGVPVDLGAMMAASIALGVAVDDTIHYLVWYREGLKELRDRHLAIEFAYRRCAPPTLQAALISGIGLFVFTLSTFTPTARMGWLMMTILIAGVIAELVMMPAILAGPLGAVFKVPAVQPPKQVPPPHSAKRKAEFAGARY